MSNRLTSAPASRIGFAPSCPLTIPRLARNVPRKHESLSTLHQDVAEAAIKAGLIARWPQGATAAEFLSKGLAEHYAGIKLDRNVGVNFEPSAENVESDRLAGRFKCDPADLKLLWVEADAGFWFLQGKCEWLQNKFPGMGAHVISTLSQFGNRSFDTITPRDILDLTQQHYWMGESDEKQALEDDGEVIITLKQVREHLPEWTTNYMLNDIPPRPGGGLGRAVWDACLAVRELGLKIAHSNDSFGLEDRSQLSAAWICRWNPDDEDISIRLFDDIHECESNAGASLVNWATAFDDIGDGLKALDAAIRLAEKIEHLVKLVGEQEDRKK